MGGMSQNDTGVLEVQYVSWRFRVSEWGNYSVLGY
jgi:hypothetical protein